MGSLEEIAAGAGVPVRSIGALRLVSQAALPHLLQALLEQHLRIVGVEGFTVEGSQVVPDEDAILDLSTVQDRTEAIKAVRDWVIRLSRPELLLELTVTEAG